jgi:hypothetical protein
MNDGGKSQVTTTPNPVKVTASPTAKPVVKTVKSAK